MQQGWRQEFNDTGDNVPDRGLNQRDHDHAPWTIRYLKVENIIIFRKNNLNLETVCF